MLRRVTEGELLDVTDRALALIEGKSDDEVLCFRQEESGEIVPFLDRGAGKSDLFSHLPTQPRGLEAQGPILLYLLALYG